MTRIWTYRAGFLVTAALALAVLRVRGQDLNALTPDEAAAWVVTLRVVLNLDEFITRE